VFIRGGSPVGEVVDKHKHQSTHRGGLKEVRFLDLGRLCFQPTSSQWSCKETTKDVELSLESGSSFGVKVVCEHIGRSQVGRMRMTLFRTPQFV